MSGFHRDELVIEVTSYGALHVIVSPFYEWSVASWGQLLAEWWLFAPGAYRHIRIVVT